MKHFFFVLFFSINLFAQAQTSPFRFAFISDTHVGSPNGSAEEDLERTVADINQMNDIDFLVLTGDITELGTDAQLKRAKEILDQLKVKWFIIPGNHDTGWSESGGLEFTRVFGYDKFHFTHNGIHFIGCASGPYVRMSDGHVPRDAVNWLQKEFSNIKSGEPVIFLNHYPLDNGLDNWYEVIDLLKTKNTLLALCGHGHSNRPVFAEDIPAVMGRSNLRAKEDEGGYNLVDVANDSIRFNIRRPLSRKGPQWKAVEVETHSYDHTKKYDRPDFSINNSYPQVQPKWTYHSSANVISTPAVVKDLVVFGNQSGEVEALDLATGKKRWTVNVKAPVFSSPAISGNHIVFGTTDDYVYSLSPKGEINWKYKTGKSVLGSPVIDGNKVFIGGSDHSYRALDLQTGKLLWSYDSLNGPVVGKPLVSGDKLIFGAWDTRLYCLDKNTGKEMWKWSNGSSVINFSPAACTPVVRDNVVYIVAPDRFMTAIDLNTGATLWRTKEATVRESIGLSEDGKLVYGKTMQDTVVAFYTNPEKAQMAWKMNVGYGYEHAPSMLIEKDKQVFFGTRNGVVYNIDPAEQKINWAYKIDNSMVNTVNVVSGNRVVAATMDGKVVLLQSR
ncbi:MAG: PQQ-binding-like beta-propeller repeat protein [Flavisolibacter sp.]